MNIANARCRMMPFLVGVISGALVVSLLLLLFNPTSCGSSDDVPSIDREEARRRGLFPISFSKGLIPLGMGKAIDQAFSNFEQIGYGKPILLTIVAIDAETALIVVTCERDSKGRDVRDLVIAYVYSKDKDRVTAKFWVPLA